VTTDGRVLQSVLRYLVGAQMKHAQRLNVLLADKHNNIVAFLHRCLEQIANIAVLDAVPLPLGRRLPAVLYRNIMVTDLGPRSQLTRLRACADTSVVFNTGPTPFWLTT